MSLSAKCVAALGKEPADAEGRSSKQTASAAMAKLAAPGKTQPASAYSVS